MIKYKEVEFKSVDLNAKDLISSMLKKSPKDRPNIHDVLKHQFFD